jgi:asparagine synthase (glutamine-hydrolysing)
MCGIAGKIWWKAGIDAGEAGSLMRKMAGQMVCRGPDAEGIWVDSVTGIAFAHRRLSIIDLDPRARQPMLRGPSPLAVTFNGEIYNFQQLRDELEDGRCWATSSDTEVLLHLYEKHGSDGIHSYLNRLRGMFAFGLWDGNNRTLLLARDPIGKKPLYYSRTADGLAFASTLKALFQDDQVGREVDEEAIRMYLRLGYVPAPLTAFRGISKLEAGHFLSVNSAGVRNEETYWRANFKPKWHLNETELSSALLEKIEDAVRLRMISDVPLGAFLSGGIDSSAVVAMMSRLSSRPVKTFSVRFAGSPLDESRYAKMVADHFGCNHNELDVDLRPDDLPVIVRHFEEPFADPAAIPTYFMAREARRHVTVVLNGDGGDEDFAGYTLRHRSYAFAENIPIPLFVRDALLAMHRLFPQWQSEGSLMYRADKFIRTLGEREWRRNISLMELFSSRELGVSDEGDLLLRKLWATAREFDGLDRELFFSFALHLPEQLLVKVDRASMAWALEARSPLLDRDFVDFCARIPVSLKLKGPHGKYIFRRAFKYLLPEAILSRSKKGFMTPMALWLKEELRTLMEDSMLSKGSLTSEMLGNSVVARLINEHITGRRNHERRIYTLLNLELWHRTFIRTFPS